jgi:acyl phosphate:glycerol-3-phosphate acyltransferase
MTEGFILIFVSYIIGSIPVGVVVSRLWSGLDIRTVGSQNIGATNVTRSVGRMAGAITLAGDVLKGILPVWFAKSIIGIDADADVWIAFVGISAFLGHTYSLFLRFKGGKGVATGLGVFLATAPLAVLPSLGIFFGMVAVWRYVSLASMVAALAFPAFEILFGYHYSHILVGIVVAVLIVVRHSDNIMRLVQGKENRLSRSKKE